MHTSGLVVGVTVAPQKHEYFLFLFVLKAEGSLAVETQKQKRSNPPGERPPAPKPTQEGCLGASQHPQGQPREQHHPKGGLLVVPKGRKANPRSSGKICWLQSDPGMSQRRRVRLKLAPSSQPEVMQGMGAGQGQGQGCL